MAGADFQPEDCPGCVHVLHEGGLAAWKQLWNCANICYRVYDFPHTCCKSCRNIDQTFKKSGYSKSGLLLVINVCDKLQMNAARGGKSTAECSLRKILVYVSAKHFKKNYVNSVKRKGEKRRKWDSSSESLGLRAAGGTVLLLLSCRLVESPKYPAKTLYKKF